MTDETKEFASIEDATPTTAIPSETDATTATTTMVTVDDRTDTTVLPSAADDDETAHVKSLRKFGYANGQVLRSRRPQLTKDNRWGEELARDAVADNLFTMGAARHHLGNPAAADPDVG